MKAQRILFIVNPVAGKGHGERVIPELKKILAGKGIKSDLIITERKGHAMEIAAQFSGVFDIITAVGGDGTISEIVNGLSFPDNNVLGVIPCGSGNDFARTIHINESLEKDVLNLLKSANIKTIDIGEVELTSANNEQIRARFLNSFGLGFDALVTKIIQKSKVLRGLPLYLSAVFKALFIYNSSYINSRFDDVYLEGKKLVIAIGNGPTAGGGFKLLPTADPRDGLLDGCIINDLSKLRIILELPKAIVGKHTKLPFVKMVKFREAEIICKEPVYAHLDGDLISEKAVKVILNLHKEKIKVIANI